MWFMRFPSAREEASEFSSFAVRLFFPGYQPIELVPRFTIDYGLNNSGKGLSLRPMENMSVLILMATYNGSRFLDEQLRYSRVKKAYQQKEPLIRQNLEEMGMDINNFDLYLRVFKTEQIVRVYVKKSDEKVWNIYSNIRPNQTQADRCVMTAFISFLRRNDNSDAEPWYSLTSLMVDDA